MNPIRVTGQPRSMSLLLQDVPAFPGATFNAGIPESIGESARPLWFGNLQADWNPPRDGVLTGGAEQAGALKYTVSVTSTEDTVDLRLSLTNLSDRAWDQTIAFNCFSPIGVREVRDHECLRHWVGMQGKLVRLRSQPRKFGPRPAIQLYPVEGAPPWREIGFVRNFDCTPDGVHFEPWMAIESRDGRRTIATVSKPGLFLFQNRAYSCIHCGPTFGPLAPGRTGHGFTRLYLVQQPLKEWYARMRRELPAVRVEP